MINHTDTSIRIWMKVSNVELEKSEVRIQLEGDYEEREQQWWPVSVAGTDGNPQKTFNMILDALDKNRRILARMEAVDDETGSRRLACVALRVRRSDARGA